MRDRIHLFLLAGLLLALATDVLPKALTTCRKGVALRALPALGPAARANAGRQGELLAGGAEESDWVVA